MATSTTARRRSAPNQATPEEAPRRQRKPSKFKRLLRTLLLVLIVIAVSVGATLYYTWPAGSALFGFAPQTDSETIEEAQPEAPVARATSKPPATKPVFSQLDPFTVTLNDGSGRSRILHVAITLRVEDEDSSILLHEYMPVVRDRVLKILSEQHPLHVQTPEGREELVDTLTAALRAPYDPNPTPPRIASVLFTAFVIQ